MTSDRDAPVRHVTTVRADGPDHLDAVLERAVVPAIERLRPAAWTFVRWVDDRGVALRVGLEGDVDAAAFRAEVAGRLATALAVDARRPLLPLPASQRVAGGWAVEPHEDADRLPWGPAEHEVCTGVVALLGHAPNGTDRLAAALAVLAALPGAPDGGWDAVAAHVTGADERGASVRSGIAARTGALADRLRPRAAALGDGDAAPAVRRLAAALAADGPPDAAAVHLLLNRLGVGPLEELALLAVLDDAGGEAASSPAAADAPDRDSARGDAAGRPAAGARPDTAPDARPPAEGLPTPGAAPTGEDGPARAAAILAGAPVLTLDAVRPAGADLPPATLAVARGETVGVLGGAAAVRSALLDAAAGRRAADEGTVDAAGPVATPEAEDALSDGLTVRENIAVLSDAAPQAVERAIAAAALQDDAARPARELDAGGRRRTAIACALAREPLLLVLDDPARGLSAVAREGVWALVRERRRTGGATLLATASTREAVALCDRVAFLTDDALDVDAPDALVERHAAPRDLHVRFGEEPDRALLAELPEVDAMDVDVRPDHWIVRLRTRDPDVLLALLEADPDVPPLAGADAFGPGDDATPTDPPHQEATPA